MNWQRSWFGVEFLAAKIGVTIDDTWTENLPPGITSKDLRCMPFDELILILERVADAQRKTT